MSRKLLVTGGAGFIGSHFVELALSSGHSVVILDALTYSGHEANLEDIGGKFEFVRGDIRDQTLVADLLSKHQIDSVLNFAAESHVDRSIDGPAAFIETNILGTYSLLEASLSYFGKLNGEDKKTFRFLQVSTDEVFGQLGETGKFNEHSPIEPSSPYSASKASAEHLVRAWHHTYQLPILITNCSNNYGPKQFPEKLIPLMITHAIEGKELPVYGDGKNVRDWIHVKDHCRGILLALEKGEVGETYLFGGNEEWRNIDLVSLLCETLDELRPKESQYSSQIKFVKDRLGHDWRYAIDDGYAKKELGYTQKYDFRSGLKETIEWYLKNPKWCETVSKSRSSS